MTGDGTRVYHFEPESKRTFMEWRHPTSPRSKKFKSQQSAGKVMEIVFLDSVGMILVDFMSKEATINSDIYSYIDTLKKLKKRTQKIQPALKMSKVLLQHDNARPHISPKPVRSSASLARQQFHIPHISNPLYSPDLAPSEFHLFRSLKVSLRTRHFSSDEEIKTAVRKWLKTQSVEFYNKEI